MSMETRETLFGPEPVPEVVKPQATNKQPKLTAAQRLLDAKLIPIDRNQSLLVPLEVERLIGDEHVARAIWALTGTLNLTKFYEPLVSARGQAGRPAWDPRLMVSIWLYGYSKGENSARALSKEMVYEPGLMWLCGLSAVNHDKLSEFRRNNREALDELFTQVLAGMEFAGWIDLDRVMHDGTKIRAQGGADSMRRKETLERHLEKAREVVKGLGNPDDEMGSQRRRAARKRAARERVEVLEAAVQQAGDLQAAKKEGDKAAVRVSMSEPEARVMKHGDASLAPSYNVQISTDAQNTVIVGVHLTQCSSDSGSLGDAMDVVEENLGRPAEQVVADGGYTNSATIIEMAERQIDFVGSLADPIARKAAGLKANGIDAAFGSEFFKILDGGKALECPAGKRLPYAHKSNKNGNVYDQYQASSSDCQACEHRTKCCPKSSNGRIVNLLKSEPAAMKAFRDKMQTEAAKAAYKRRGPVAEFPNAWIKEKFRLRKFRLRGMAKAGTEALWACLTYNALQWIRFSKQAAAAA
jgi:transposase